MDKFSEAYAKARAVVTTQKFSPDWQTFLKNEAKLPSLLQVDAPDTAHADGLEKLRRKLANESRNALVAFFVGGGKADKIIEAATNGTKDAKVVERAATIKLLKHLYLASKRGGQDVWVCATPKAYSQWIYDELDEGNMASKLGKDDEVYAAGDRRMMCDALQLALKWSQDAMRKLADGKETTRAIVKRWFADEDTTDPQITTALGTLKDGFRKIADVCNSGKLVFSDHPPDRADGGWKDWAFVYRREPMNVVYLQGAFLKSGSSGKLWMCALTIIHELSHREVGTDDNAYDHDGLKPAKGKLTHAKAINNADSWAYFCLDLAGVLAEGDRNRVLV